MNDDLSHVSSRRPWSRLAISLPLFVLPLGLLAQDTPAQPATQARPAGSDENVIELEEVRVTGSNIRRPVEEEGALPVTVLDFSTLDAFDASSAIELFEYLPQAGETNINESNTLGADARGDVSSVNLRGIGSGNSLVLLNGRRLTPHPISQAENRVPALSVNVNILPLNIVERVEVLRDGASAVYGADAAAGVLNTITRTDYNRTQAAVRYQFTELGRGDELRFTASHGFTFNEGKTYFAASVERWERQSLRTRDRAFSANADNRQYAPPPWDGVQVSYLNPDTGNTSTFTDNDWDNRSSTSYYGQWVVGTANPDGTFTPVRPTTGINTGTGSAGNLQLQVASAAASLGSFSIVPLGNGTVGFLAGNNTPSRVATNPISDYYYNLNEFRTILPSVTRYSAYGIWTHKFNNGIEAFGDLLAFYSSSTTFRDPVGADSTDDPGIYVPASNPWNPVGVRFYHPTGENNADGTPRNIGTPRDLLIRGGTGVRFRDWGERVIEVESTSYRFLAGLRGRIFDTWQWESAVNYSFARTEDIEYNGIRESRLREALARTDETAFNPFGYTFRLDQVTTTGTNRYRVVVDQPYSNPQSVLDEITDPFQRIGRTSLATIDVKADGELFKLWAGPVRAAVGAEFRYETYEDWRPPFAGMNPPEAVAARPDLYRPNDNDFIALSPNANIDTDRNVISGFSEVLIPLVSPRQKIPFVRSLELAVAGRYESFSIFGDTFVPKVSLAWRPFSWALLRASYNESFRAPNLVQTNPDPIQRSVTSISDTYRSMFPDGGSRTRTVFRGGNQMLNPETTDTLIFGAVVEVPFVKGLTVSVDHWRMNQRDVIDAPTGTRQTRLDADFLQEAVLAQLAAGVPVSQLSAYDANGNYLGNPYVVRHPPTPDDIAAYETFNANAEANGLIPRAPVGAINYLINDYLNLAGRDVSGFDFAFDWRIPRGKLGRLNIRGEATYLTRFDELLDEATPLTNERWIDGNPKWRGNLSATWRFSNITASLSAFYQGSRLDSSSILGVSDATQANQLARWEAVGRPSYAVPTTTVVSGTHRTVFLYKIPDWVYFNASVRYSFRQRSGWLRNAHLRLGVINLTNETPPITDETRGYRGPTSLARGRTFNIEVGKRF